MPLTPQQDSITLFLSERAAKAAAAAKSIWHEPARIVPGTLRWSDGSVEQGWKVQMRDAKGSLYWL